MNQSLQNNSRESRKKQLVSDSSLNLTYGGGSMGKLYDTPIKAIRKNCLDCCCGQVKEIRLCPVVSCACYPYRMGRRPDEATVDTLKEFYGENVEPTTEF